VSASKRASGDRPSRRVVGPFGTRLTGVVPPFAGRFARLGGHRVQDHDQGHWHTDRPMMCRWPAPSPAAMTRSPLVWSTRLDIELVESIEHHHSLLRPKGGTSPSADAGGPTHESSRASRASRTSPGPGSCRRGVALSRHSGSGDSPADGRQATSGPA
jgi:hypothetical protein